MKKKAPAELCLILVGERWTGKSWAGNTMLGETVFESDIDTEHVVHSFGVIEGRNVILVDTPGWDAGCSPDVPLRMLKQGHSSASMLCPGFHVLLLTVNMSLDRMWNQKSAERLLNTLKLFNDDMWKHTMLLFTNTKLPYSTELKAYLEGSGQPLKSLVEKCKHRCHVLNKHSDVPELLEKIEQMVQENYCQSLQLVTSKHKVGKHEMDNRQWVERYSKMKELIGRESCFSNEDCMFKSLSPPENDPPNLTEQCELPEENSIYVLRSESQMANPVDVHDVALECIHFQDDDDDDIGMDQIPRDEQKDNKYLQYSTLQENIPQTLDNSWHLSIYKDVLNQQCGVTSCVLQISIYWGKIKMEWIFFTLCGDDQLLNWLFIMVLCTYVSEETGEQNMIKMVSGSAEHHQEPSIEKEEITQCSLMKDAEKILQECMRGEDEDMNEGRNKALCQKNQKDEEEKEIPQQNVEGEELMKHIHKSEEEEKEEEEEEEEENEYQQIIEVNEKILYQCKRGDNQKIFKNDHNNYGDNILQYNKQRQRADDDYRVQHGMKLNTKQIVQNNKSNEVTDQKSNTDENDDWIHQPSKKGCKEGIPQQSKKGCKEGILKPSKKGFEEGILRPSKKVCNEGILQPSKKSCKEGILKPSKKSFEKGILQPSKKSCKEGILQPRKKVCKEEIPQPSKKSCKEGILQPSKKVCKEEIPQPSKKGCKEGIPQPSKKSCKEEILQPSKKVCKEEIPQPSKKSCKEGILQPSKKFCKKEIPQPSKKGCKEGIPQPSKKSCKEKILQPSKKVCKEAIPKPSKKGCKEGIPQHSKKGCKEGIPQPSRKGCKEEIPQPSKKGCKEELPQLSKKGIKEEILQPSKKGCKEAIPQPSKKGCKEGIPQPNKKGCKEGIPQPSKKDCKEEIPQPRKKGCKEEILQPSKKGYKEEIPQPSRKGCTEEIPQPSKTGCKEELPQPSKKGIKEEILQPSKKGCKEGIPQPNKKGCKEEIPQPSRKGCKEEIPQPSKKGCKEGIPQPSKTGIKEWLPQHIKSVNKEEIPLHTKRDDKDGKVKEAPKQQVKGKVFGKAEKMLGSIRGRVEFEGSRIIWRSQSMDLNGISLRYAGEEHMRQHRGFWKIRRTKSLERFETL